MIPTSSGGRTLSLRAPITNETERAFFQRRLSYTLFIVGALALGFWLVQLTTLLVRAREHVGHLFTEPAPQLHLALVSLCLVVSFVLRRGRRSVGELDSVDAAVTLVVCVGWAMMIHVDRRMTDVSAMRGELVILLASSYTLATRAALLPSTPARTFALSLAGFAPVLPVTYSLYAGSAATRSWPIGPTIYAATWSAVGIACTTTISHVIYGLRQEVRKAQRLGQYLLEEKIGEGGMGVVYRASHALLRRPAAIKLLGSAEQGSSRFEREVRITARLTHPNTIAVFDYGRTPNGRFYYAMEYLEGISLEDLVVEHGPQPARRVVHVLLQACGALEEAHANGLVHRDIKPANIMLTSRGLLPDFVKVLDFGLVKEIDPSLTDPGQSSVSTVMGTPHYMAPEAIVDPATLDGRADLYALGATAYYLLTGERVFDGTNLVEVCSQHLHQAPVAPSRKRPDVPEVLEKIVLACLEKKREARPKDAAALARLLEEARDELGEWTREEATAWWAARAGGPDGAGAKTKKRRSTTSAPGETIAVALDDRRGAA